ncbi:MAG: autoinducer binding domain-containing protein [Pseudomonadota bacterium]
MHGNIAAYLERVDRCDTLTHLDQAVADLRGLFQVDHAVYHAVNSGGEPYALNTYTEAWGEHYLKETLYTIDPVVLSAFTRFQPYNWKSLDWDKKSARKFFSEAVDGGVGNQGVSVPIRGPHGEFALFSLSHTCPDGQWAGFLQRSMQHLLLVGHFLHQAVRRLEDTGAGGEYITLSPRETDTLQLLSAGHNRGKISEKLKISEHTLRVYIESARFKLGATNTTHAVAKAMSQGLIAL